MKYRHYKSKLLSSEGCETQGEASRHAVKVLLLCTGVLQTSQPANYKELSAEGVTASMVDFAWSRIHALDQV